MFITHRLATDDVPPVLMKVTVADSNVHIWDFSLLFKIKLFGLKMLTSV